MTANDRKKRNFGPLYQQVRPVEERICALPEALISIRDCPGELLGVTTMGGRGHELVDSENNIGEGSRAHGVTGAVDGVGGVVGA